MSVLSPYNHRFIRFLEVEKRMSKHTLLAYANDLLQLENFLMEFKELKSIQHLDHAILRAWVVDLKEKGITHRSINRKLSTVKSFFKYLIKNKIVEEDSTSKLITPKTSSKLPTFFSSKQMETLLTQMEEEIRGFDTLRDYLLISLLYTTGIRQAELIHLKSKDVSSEYIKVLGKRNKERIVPVLPSIKPWLDKYMKERDNIASTEEFLFLTNAGKKMYPKFVFRITNKYISYVSTEQKRSPHTLRHSFATNTLNNGAKLHTIKEVLGHSSLNATQVYTHNSIERLKEAYKKFHKK